MHRFAESHADLWVPPSKDIYFFDQHWDRGVGWYEAHFVEAPAGAVLGDISHDYLYSDAAASRIDELVPNARLLVFLRDPLRRAVSHLFQSRRNGTVSSSSVELALEQNPGILDCSLYGKHLSRYRAAVEDGRLAVLYFEDLRDDPTRFAQELCAALHVDPGAYRDVDASPRNSARVARWPAVGRAVHRASALARDKGHGRLVGRLKRSRLLRRALYQSVEERELQNALNEMARSPIVRRSLSEDRGLLEAMKVAPHTGWTATQLRAS